MTGKLIIDKTLPPNLGTNNVSANSNGQFTVPYSTGDVIEMGVKSGDNCTYSQTAQSQHINIDPSNLNPGNNTLCFKITDKAGNIRLSEMPYALVI